MEQKRAILTEAAACTAPGEIGALNLRCGPYSSMLGGVGLCTGFWIPRRM